MTRCRHCNATWTSLGACHCGGNGAGLNGCHLTFSVASAFDLHRRGGECKDPAKAGLIKSKRAGIDWCYPGVKPLTFEAAGAL
jgi:hypothetical protein